MKLGGITVKTKVLLFGDPGIDDSFAIIYALLNPNIDLVGIVTSYGNVTKEQATANAAYLLQLANQQDVPVIPGAANPVQEEKVTYYPEIHGSNGIGPIRPPRDMIYEVYPFETIKQIIQQYPNELVIVDLGRSTSLATAFILFNEEIKKVKAFYVMGGAFFVPGNATALAEANFYGDPTSSNYVLENAHNLTITPLNVTQFALITSEMVDRLKQESNSPFVSLFSPIFEYYFEFYKKKTPGIQGAPIHDLLTMMVVTSPSIVEYVYYDAKVIDGPSDAKGLSFIDIRPASPKGKTRIAVKLDYEKFVHEFFKVMI
jgi:purine nucleosidase